MSTDETRAFMDRYFAAMSEDKSPGNVARFVADEGLKEHIATFEAAFPHYQLTIDEMVVEGDRVAVALRVTATHRGPFLGVAPTGKAVTIPGMYFYRIADGRIVAFRAQADLFGLMQQLGATAGAPTTAAA